MADIENNDASSASKPPQRKLSFLHMYKMPIRKEAEYTTLQTILLSYQTLGVVYGDLATSPLYVFPSTKLENPEERDILGIYSLIFWTLTMIGLVKYVVIALHANDHGEGGTFALYSLIRQHINFKGRLIMPSTRLDSDVQLKFHSERSSIQSKAQTLLEKSATAQNVITFLVLLGTCMVIGDGALTPAISVLSAVQGIQSISSQVTQEDVVLLSVAILFVLFLCQKFGTHRVSVSFSPIMILWCALTSTMGAYNIIKYYPLVFKAISPQYIFYFFEGKKKVAWELLGSIALCITGAEAMFADMGHFSKHSIQIAFSCLVYPSLIVTYGGQTAYLIKHPDKMSTAFYSSVPQPVYWPTFVIATLAAIVASQCLISASFSIIRQSIALGCFPRVTMIHTSEIHEGQIYSPEVNYFLMIACVVITLGFKGGVEIGNAFGVAVIWVMLITTILIAVVMVVIWNTNIILVGIFFVMFLLLEGTYMTSLLNKVPQGGWVPFAISVFFFVITLSWTYGRSKKSEYEARMKLDVTEFEQLVKSSSRVPGICFFCTDLINGIPPIVRHYIQNVGSLRQITVLVTVRILPVRTVLPEERFVVAKMGSMSGVYRCLVQFGYMDKHDMEGDEYVETVMRALKNQADGPQEKEMLETAVGDGVIFVLGRTLLRMNDKGGWLRCLVIDNLYRFLQKNFRSNVATLKIPPERMLQVGMLYTIYDKEQ